MTSRRLVRGFTLIEMMIVVAMIAILAAIALPSYRRYVTRSKLPQAFALLSGMSLAAQQYYQDNRSYAAAASPGATVCPMAVPTAPNFAFSCSNVGAANITMTATGTAADLSTGQPVVYSVDQAGNRSTSQVPSDWSALPAGGATCWVRDQSGNC